MVCLCVCLLRAFFSFIYSDAASLDASTHTLTNETFNESNDACEMSDVITAPKRKKNNNKQQETELNGECSNEALSQQLTSTSPSTSCSSGPGSGDIDAKDDDDNDDDDGKNTGKNYKRRNSNNGNSISLPRTPLDTPIPRRREFTKKRNNINSNGTANIGRAANAAASGAITRRNNTSTDKDTFVQVKNAKTTIDTNCNGKNKESGSDDVPTETKSVNGSGMSTRKKRTKYLNMVGSSSSNKVFEHDSERDSDSLASINKQRAASTSNKSDAMRRLSVSNATLRNVNVPLFLASCRLLWLFQFIRSL